MVQFCLLCCAAVLSFLTYYAQYYAHEITCASFCTKLTWLHWLFVVIFYRCMDIKLNLAYYASIMLNAIRDLLCLKLCWHNRPWPTPSLNMVLLKISHSFMTGLHVWLFEQLTIICKNSSISALYVLQVVLSRYSVLKHFGLCKIQCTAWSTCILHAQVNHDQIPCWL